MIRKRFAITSVLVLSAIALASTGGLIVSAWSSAASYTCLGTSALASCGATSSNSYTESPAPSFVAGTAVTDNAIIADPSGIFGGGPCPGSSCVTGTVTFNVYNGLTCSGQSIASSGTLTLSGTTYPGAISYTHTFSTPGSYSIRATYKGDYSDNVATNLPCEPVTMTSSSGVPEFPLGALGMLALIGMMIPLMLVMRTRFTKNLTL